jgi:hypothetical protein
VTLTDLAGDDNHYAAHVVSAQFAGKPRVKQHKLVYAALRRAHGRRTARLATDHRRSQLGCHGHPASGANATMSDVNSRISDLVNSNDVVLFMKGTPLFPQCGFSSRAVAILDHCGVAV